MSIKTLIALLMLVSAAPAGAFPVDLRYEPHGFSVTAPAYEFRFDLAKPRMSEFRLVNDGRAGDNILDAGMDLLLTTSHRTYRSSASARPARLHPIRIGRYLTEVSVENIVLAAEDGEEWPGLGEITFYCHADRVYVCARLICNDEEWVKGNLTTYQAYERHRDCPDTEVTAAGAAFSLKTGASLNLLLPDKSEPTVSSAKRVPMEAGRWTKGSRHDAYFIIFPGGSAEAVRALQEELSPLPASAFRMTRGEINGYSCRKGVYELTAKDSNSPQPPRDFYGGCTFTVQNDERPRRILIEQLNDWGGLRGAVIRDGDGNPLPIRPQICVNFPELGRHGEPDWAFVLYPLDLAPGEKTSITADHLYLGYGKNEQILLMSLENVGNPVLMQTSVATVESHTMTTGLYFANPDNPHNDLRLNDFRMYKGEYGGYRSVSAVLPSFFRYLDSSGRWHKVVPEHVEIAFEGPVYVDYTSTGRTDDGKVKVTVRTVQMPHSDITRVFNYVTVEFLEDVSVDSSSKSNIRFAQHFTFNPMVFLKYAYTAEGGAIRAGELDLSGTIKEDGTLLGEKPFVCAYYAPNGIDEGIPCSDITGNPGFVLLDWKANINGSDVRPGLYVFPAKDIASGGDYSRDLAVVPADQVGEIKAGSKVEYAVEHFVFGDVKSDYTIPAGERQAFALKPPKVKVLAGEKVSDFPPVIRASGGKAEFRLTGGTNKLAVGVDGFPTPDPIKLYRRVGDGYRPVEQGVHGNDWYQCHEDGAGGYGFIFLAEPGAEYKVESTEHKEKPTPLAAENEARRTENKEP